ncbi:MAG: GAF domain-containing protein [Dehalococcoidales bacterium]|nr:GAF domain-containing protein [Dehalococcoidales bacterium]
MPAIRKGITTPGNKRLSASYLQEIINSLEDEMLVIDKDYRIVEANTAVLKRHGSVKRKDVIGKYCYDVAHGLSEVCHPHDSGCPIRTVWETGKPARVTHAHVYDAHGEPRQRYLDIIATPIKDARGSVTLIVELMRDVTEAKESELKMTEAHHNLLTFNAISTTVSQSLDLDMVLSSALTKTLEIMNRNTGGILLWDEEKRALCYRVHHGLSPGYVQSVCYLPGEGIAGRVAASGKPILVEDASNDPRVAYADLMDSEGLKAFASVPLRAKGKILGVLNIASHSPRRFSREDIQLLEGIAAQVAIAVENARLHREVQHKDEIRGELLREIFSIQEEERKRIARELHDETAQSLASLAASLEAVTSMVPAGKTMLKTQLNRLQKLSISALDEIHKLIYELRPSLLDDLGLVAAVRWLADNNLGSTGVAVNFRTAGRARRLPPKLETTLFRVVQEAINNIARHAGAKNAEIALTFRKGSIEVRIKDDGAGFDVEEAISSRDRPRGLGLLGMRERVEIFNGSFNIRSNLKGGTEINVKIPVKIEVAGG